jgi:hypothetical protein
MEIVKMIKHTVIAALLGLAVTSNAVLAQGVDLRSPAIPGPDRSAQKPPMTDEQKQAEQKRVDQYWATHNDDAPGYPFNP